VSFDVLFVHGPPAAGKFTVAKVLAGALDWPLFHNHLGVDAALGLFEFGTPEFVELRARFWREGWAAAARARRSFIFTFNPENSVDPALIDELVALVRDAGGRVHFVELICSLDAIRARLVAEDRGRFEKLRDGALFEAARAAGAFEFPPLPAPLVRVDTSAQSPQEAADLILAALDAAT